jgi:hypothetical protein
MEARERDELGDSLDAERLAARVPKEVAREA